MVLRSIHLFIHFIRRGLIIFLVGGRSNNKPKQSVTKPGKIKRIPPTKTHTPSNIAFPGGRPDRISACALRITSNPSFFNRIVPSIPVRIITITVFQMPIVFPDISNTPISSAGRRIKIGRRIRTLAPPQYEVKAIGLDQLL